jgi:tripartite-type tricarboxylate transporter receptor subunit TctC
MNDGSIKRRMFVASAAGVGAAAMVPSWARAQAAWPSKAIRLVVPFAPGGSSEIVARATAAELSKLLGQSVFVDNKPGAAGNVAMGEVARADDQHTVILGHIGTLAVNPYIFDKLPYDPKTTFRPLSLLSKVPSLYVVRPVRISANVTGDFGERDRFERSVLSCVEWIVGSGRLRVVGELRG